MNSILITGCNRGLGLGLVKAFVNWPEPPKHIFATCRNKRKAKELMALASKYNFIHILQGDLREQPFQKKIVAEIEKIVAKDGLNVLFNNAGIAPKSTRINIVNRSDLFNTLEINTIVPILLAKVCLPLLKNAAKTKEGPGMCVQRASIINMSSILGSISDNREGGLYPYRTSKAALNAVTKSLSIDLYGDGILCVSLHPGWVRTDMGGSNAPLDVDTSASSVVQTIFSLNEKHTGGFYDYNGQPLQW